MFIRAIRGSDPIASIREDTMNHDDQNPNFTPLNDPELEARIVAWVAGEASAFEVAELTRLIGEKPELGIFKRRIEAVHGLVGEAIKPDHAPLRLSEERRTKLLQAIGGSESVSTTGASDTSKPVVVDFNATRKATRKYQKWVAAVTTIASIAACLAVGLFSYYSLETKLLIQPDPVPVAIEADEGAPALSARIDGDETEAHAVSDQKFKRQPPAEAGNKKQKQDAPKFALPALSNANEGRDSVLQQVREESLAAATGTSITPPPGNKSWGYYDDNHQLKTRGVKGGSNAAPQVFSMYGKVAAQEKRASKPEAEKATTSDGKIELSPFSVTTDRSTQGYVASNTLAGTRGRTDLKDISSSISVVTGEFLRDTGATNAKELLTYTTGTEVGGTRGNFTRTTASSDLAGTVQPGRPASAPAAPVNDSHFYGALRFDPQLLADADNQSLKAKYEEPAPATLSTDQLRDNLAKNGPLIRVAALDDSEKYKQQPAFAAGQPIPPSETKNLKNDLPLAPPSKSTPVAEPVEVNASKEPVSTFPLHVSDVSFRLAQAALAANESIDPARIRPEEFYNAFNYGDPTPSIAEKVSCRVEQAAHPFLQQRNLVRIALRVAASGRDAAQPLHLTVLLDHSGSMEREDRMATVQRAMQSLVSLLGPNDRITLIGFARQPSLLAESLTGDQSAQLLDLIAHTPAEGGTNLEEALKLGGELARRQFEPSAQNRIVLLTDGAANLGNADPEQLAHAIETLRQQGIAFDACGVGLEGLDDAMLESLTRKGDGRYYVLNSPEAADAGFAHQLAGAFRPAAENVKLQVRFNPARVGNYRLIGFEQHRLREEDFRNDAVDAAELAAEEAAVAVYQVEPLPQGEGELGEVYVRFRDASSGTMVERSWTLSYDPQAPAFDRATPSMQLAGTAALLAEKLRGGQNAATLRLGELAPVVNQLRSHFAHESRVQDLATMFKQTRRRFGE